MKFFAEYFKIYFRIGAFARFFCRFALLSLILNREKHLCKFMQVKFNHKEKAL